MDLPCLKARSYSALRLNHDQNLSKNSPREADDVVRVDVELKTSYSRFLGVAGHGENRKGVGRGKKLWTPQSFSPRTSTGGTRGKDVQHTWNTMIIHVPAVINTWGDAVRRETSRVCHGQGTVIRRVFGVGITGNSVCLSAYHWQTDFFLYISLPGHG